MACRRSREVMQVLIRVSETFRGRRFRGATNMPPMQKTTLSAIFWRFGRLRLFRIGNGAMAMPQSLRMLRPALLNLSQSCQPDRHLSSKGDACVPYSFLVQAFALCTRIDRFVPEILDWNTSENGVAGRPDEKDDNESDQTTVDLAEPSVSCEDTTALEQNGHLGSGKSCLIDPDGVPEPYRRPEHLVLGKSGHMLRQAILDCGMSATRHCLFQEEQA
jgi:hypothetical protein